MLVEVENAKRLQIDRQTDEFRTKRYQNSSLELSFQIIGT